MRRPPAPLTALALLLAACGQVVTLTLPGGADLAAPPRGYALLYSPAPHAFRRAEAPEPVRRGRLSERYELRDGDCGGSDCGNFRARAQIAEDKDATRARLDRDIWYGWSFHNATIGATTPDSSLGLVVGEWKLEGEQPAIFRLIQRPQGGTDLSGCAPSVCTVAGTPSDDIVVELDEIAQAQGWGPERNGGDICRLWSMEAERGRWVDVVVNTNFGTDGYGTLRVWVNGELRCNYLGQMVSAERARTQVPGPTHRRGLFASFTRPYAQSQGGAPLPTLVAYYDEFLVGASRAEVDTRLREASGLAPVD